MAAASYYSTVQKAYIAFYGRPADPNGLTYWATRIDAAGGNINSIIQAFGTSTEATNLYGSLSNAAAVNSLYQQIFGRSADITGLNFYVGKLLDGSYTLVDIAQRIIDGASGSDATIVSNKLSAAQSFTNAIDTASEVIGYAGTAAASAARDWMATVDSTAASVTSATASISTTLTNIVSNVVTTGSTFTLSSAGDVVNGTSANDLISAAGGNLNSNDLIVGSAGTDTLSVRFGTADTGVAPSVSSVEIISLRYADSASLDFADIKGYSAVKVEGSGTAHMSALQETATLSLENGFRGFLNVDMTAGTTAYDLTINYNSATTAAQFSASDADTLTIVANQASVFVGTASIANGVSAIEAKGSGTVELRIDGNMTAATALNAASAGGALSLFVQSGAQELKVTGSSGNDTVTYYGSSLSTGDHFIGGAGTDTIRVSYSTAGAVLPDELTGVEVFELDANTAFTNDMTAFAGSALDIRLGSSVTMSGLASSVTSVSVESGVSTAANLTLGYRSASDVTIAFKTSAISTSFETASQTQTALCAGSVTFIQSGNLTITVDSAMGTGAGNAVIHNLVAASAQNVTLSLAGDLVVDSSVQLATADSFSISGASTGVSASMGSASLLRATAVNIYVGDAGAVGLGSANFGQLADLNITVAASGLASAASINFEANTSYGTAATANVVQTWDLVVGASADIVIASAAYDNTGLTATLQLDINVAMTNGNSGTDVTIASLTIDDFLTGACADLSFAGTGNIHLGPIEVGSGANADGKLVISTTALGTGSTFSAVLNNSAQGTVGATAITISLGDHGGQLLDDGGSAVTTVRFGNGAFTAYVGEGADRYYMSTASNVIAVGTTAIDTALYSAAAGLGTKTVYNIGTGDVILLRTLTSTAWAVNTGTSTNVIGTALWASANGGGILYATAGGLGFTAIGTAALIDTDDGTTGIATGVAPFAVYTQDSNVYIQVLVSSATLGSAMTAGVGASAYVTFLLDGKDLTAAGAVTAAFQLNYSTTLGGLTLTVL